MSESKHRVRAYTNTACRAEARTHFEQIHKKGVCTHEEQTYEHQADTSRVRCHFRESKEVQYYANLLCLSPKYFGSIIKENTGTSASDWISQYVIVQAKSLLRHNKDLNIQQISYQLGFTDPAAFTRYFKANAGLSPKEYREQQSREA